MNPIVKDTHSLRHHIEIPTPLSRDDLVDQVDKVAAIRDEVDVDGGDYAAAYGTMQAAVIWALLSEGDPREGLRRALAKSVLIAASPEAFAAFEADVSAEREHNANVTVVGGPFERGAA